MHLKRLPTWTSVALIFAFWACLSGCGDDRVPTYPASGRVVFPDGSPLPGGNIEFAPQAGTVKTSARAMIEEDGTFRLTTFRDGDGALAGVHRVAIIPARRRGQRADEAERSFDGKYQDFETSGLEATIASGSPNEFKFVVHPARKSETSR